SVDGHCQIIVACFVTDAVNDKEQAVPLAEATLENLQQAEVAGPPGDDGGAQKIPATLDAGYYSEQAVAGLEARGFDPHMATGRQKHNQGKVATTDAVPVRATAKEKMQAKLRAPAGHQLYAQRK